MTSHAPGQRYCSRLNLKAFLRIGLYFSVISAILFTVADISTANPFTQKKTSRENHSVPETVTEVQTAPNPPDAKPGVMERMISFQMAIKENMTARIREAKETGRFGPLLWVLAAAFVYGVVHSAGPGHGKAVALSYIAAVRPGLVRALAFGNILAASHGLSGIGLVFTAKFILQTSISGSLASVTRATQMTSYIFIIILGLFLFFRKLPVWGKKSTGKAQRSGCTVSENKHTTMTQPSLAPAVFMGMIPCPGVVLALLFCLSLGMTGFGLILGLTITLGMAVTLSCVVLAAMAGKSVLLNILPRHPAIIQHAADILEAFAGAVLAIISTIFLLTTLQYQ